MTQLIIWFGILFLVMWLLVIRPKKKEEQKKQALLTALKKGDKVVTIGGMIGTVMDLRDDEVVLKVDESTNTRIRFARAAISKIVGEEK
jgi:preprotein translocase subunit YajC